MVRRRRSSSTWRRSATSMSPRRPRRRKAAAAAAAVAPPPVGCADALGRSVGRGREDDVSIEVTQSLACPRRIALSSCRVFSLHSLRAVRALVRADCDPRRPRNARGARDARGLVVLAAAADQGVEMWANLLFSPLIVSSFLLAPRGEASPFLRRSPALRPPAPRPMRRARHVPRAVAVRHTRRAWSLRGAPRALGASAPSAVSRRRFAVSSIRRVLVPATSGRRSRDPHATHTPPGRAR